MLNGLTLSETQRTISALCKVVSLLLMIAASHLLCFCSSMHAMWISNLSLPYSLENRSYGSALGKWPRNVLPCLSHIFTFICGGPGFFTPAYTCVFNQVPSWSFVLGVQVAAAFVLATSCCASKLMAASFVDICDIRNRFIKCIDWRLPILAQPFYLIGKSRN